MQDTFLCRAGVAEWFTVPRLLRMARVVMGLSPEPLPMLADISSGMYIQKAQLPYWPLHSQQTRGEFKEQHTGKKACKKSTLALIPRSAVTRSPKQSPTKGLMSSKNLIKIFFNLKKKLFVKICKNMKETLSVSIFNCNGIFVLLRYAYSFSRLVLMLDVSLWCFTNPFPQIKVRQSMKFIPPLL